MSSPAFKRSWWDALFIIYFVSHIPISMLMDFQLVLPARWYPKSVQEVLKWYQDTYQDAFMNPAKSPLWFRSFVWCEVFIQLPMFFIITWGLWYRTKWVRTWAIVYGAHVATTLVPILAITLLGRPSDFPGGKRPDTYLMLTAFYTPYLVSPLLLILRMTLLYEPFDAIKPKRQ